MEFFCYHRDRAGSQQRRDELVEQHWSYMDRWASVMIARGPTFAGDVPTGSVHILDLADPATARAFAFDEPNHQAGVYRDVLIRRWRNTLGRTMWDFPGGREGGRRFLVLGLGDGDPVDGDRIDGDRPDGDRPDGDRPDGDRVDGDRVDGESAPDAAEELIAYGPLLSDDGGTWLGTAALLRAADPDAARAVLRAERYAQVEVHDWAFGGRPD